MNLNLINFDNYIFDTTWNTIDFVYATVQEVFAYNFTSKIIANSSLMHDNNYFLLYEIFFKFIFLVQAYELFFSNIMDNFLKDFLIYFEFTENNFRKFIGLIDPTLFSVYHPEIIFINSNLKLDIINNSVSHLNFTIIDFVEKNSIIAPINFFIQGIILFFFIAIILTFFFSFFSKNKEEWQIDADYTISNTSAEAEKELFSIDDAVSGVFFLVLLFGSYFGFLFLGWNISFSETFIFFVPLLFVFYFILLIPFNLLFDFGFFFITYLRGASNTSSLFFEFIYDYIGIIAFFTRLLVQFVRLVLMFVVYCLMHDAVMLQCYSQQNFLMGDNFWEELMTISPNGNSIMFFFFVTFPLRLAYWFYECLHTFFVVTVQFAAFFTIIFWLFLLFYTFFVYEKYENHFDNLNKFHNNLISELKKIK